MILLLEQQLLEPPSQHHAEALARLALPPPPATTDFALACDLGTQDAERMFDRMTKVGHGHAVPPWSAPRTAWKDMLVGPPATQSAILRRALVDLCGLIRWRDRTPLAWSLSWTAALDKRNGKKKAAQDGGFCKSLIC